MNIINNIANFLSNSKLELPEEAIKFAANNGFELAGYKITASEEQLRAPRNVRIGAVQNRIVLPTNQPIAQQVKYLSNNY